MSVVHYALLQDHPGVLREQSTSTSDRSCPGDLYHPNFHLGHPTYFDLSVQCSTQRAVISSAASQAGVAAAAGEEAKDAQYLDIVDQSGGDFAPLVCETFGVWTPFALSTVYHCTVKNGLPRRTARRQQLLPHCGVLMRR